MQFKIIIDDAEFTAEMENTKLVNEIEDLTPLKLGFKRYKDHEYFGRLNKELDITGEKLINNVNANDIVFYSGENAITIFFKSVIIDPFEVVYLGKFNEDISQFLENKEEIISLKLDVLE